MHMASHKQYVASTNKLFHTPHHIYIELACRVANLHAHTYRSDIVWQTMGYQAMLFTQ